MPRLTGWGRTAATAATVVRPADAAAARGVVLGAGPRGIGFRGLGRSYGDAAQAAGGTVLETLALDRVRTFDGDAGVVVAGAGLSIDALLRRVVPSGWFVPVSPGTRMVTLGGAVAADVHGKNHHRDGSFSRHVLALELVTADGTVHRLAPGDELFDATAGGMGLTGLITEVTLQLIPVATSYVEVRTERAGDLAALMGALERADAAHRYSVAWIDCLASGRRLGRGVVTAGDHADRAALQGPALRHPLAFDPATRLAAPPVVPSGLLNRASVGVFNEVWFRRAPARPTRSIEHAAGFFHPLDGVADWNRIYGPRGFVQYQYVVPFGAEEAVERTIRMLSDAGAASFLAVLKRFGAEGTGLLSFPRPGWTLALDLPVRSGLAELLDRLDEVVLAAGGRLYLAKDARMPTSMLAAGYPDLERFRSVRRRVDPEGRLMTDLARRLGL